MKKKAKLNIVEMKIDDLIPADYNPRKISNDAKIGLKHSINKHGYVQNIIYNKRTGNLVSGHQRVAIMREDGITDVDVHVVDLPLEEEKVLNVQMNNHMIEGDFTSDVESLLMEIADYDPDTYDTAMMYDLVSNVEFDEEEDKKEDTSDEEYPDPEMDIERMALMPFESYDAIVIVCTDSQDFAYLREKFGLRKVNMSPLGNAKKIGQNRVVDARRVIKILGK